MAGKLYYNYAVVDPAYPEEPNFWSLSGFSLGDAARIGWTSEFVPGADATTQLLLSNLHRQGNKITLAIPDDSAPSKEPKWANGTFYDQVLIEVSSDDNISRKLTLYHVRVLNLKRTVNNKFGRPVKVILCQVGRGGYVVAH